jgi:hypothetical protein
MEELLTRVGEMLIGREHGPFAFRIINQPMVAGFLAIRAGLRDARAGRPAYGWTVTTDPVHRRELIRQGNFFGPQLANAYTQAVAAGCQQVTIKSIFEVLRRPF